MVHQRAFKMIFSLTLIYRGIAQLVEQRSPKPRAEGSSPSAPAKEKTAIGGLFSLAWLYKGLEPQDLSVKKTVRRTVFSSNVRRRKPSTQRIVEQFFVKSVPKVRYESGGTSRTPSPTTARFAVNNPTNSDRTASKAITFRI